MLWKGLLAAAVSVATAMLLAGCGGNSTDDLPSEQTAQSIESMQGADTQRVDQAAIGSFKSMGDPFLLRYVEDTVYRDLVNELDSDAYFVENVEAVFVSQEYIDELAYNSQENIFFGYTLSELDRQFQGKRYLFTTDESGKTIVKEVEAYDDTYNQVICDVAAGTGVILVCVTVSAVSGGTALPAISTVFATAAKTGAIGALSGGLIGGVSAGVVTGMQTGNMGQALRVGARGAGEGYKWGAICGVLTGGALEATALKGATLNGLSMNEAAKIQKESKYSLDVIKKLHSIEEYNVYKAANLEQIEIAADSEPRLLLAREIDLALRDEKGRTNCERMEEGLSPLAKVGDRVEKIELHHVGQRSDGALAMLTTSEHDAPALHGYLEGASGVQAELGAAWNAQRKSIWRAYAKKLSEEK